MGLKRTICLLLGYSSVFVFLGLSEIKTGTLSSSSQHSPSISDEMNRPLFEKNTPIYADIDTTDQSVYVVVNKGIWKYDLNTSEWELLMSVDEFPEPLSELEFGYDAVNGRLLLWSRGVGTVYQVDHKIQEIRRIDKSFAHKNQYGHFPFFRKGQLHAFGGYGFWKHKNYITFFNTDIDEWSLVSTDRDSDLPTPRAPLSGVYASDKDELFIFGGDTIIGNRQDDKNAIKQRVNDLWRYSFDTGRWQKEHDFKDNEWRHYHTSSIGAIHKVNSKTQSFYSSVSGYWYLPVAFENTPEGIYYLKAYDLKTNRGFKPIELMLGDAKEFIISNYLFNPKKREAVLVGIDRLTNRSELPLRVVTISEDSLLSNVEEADERWTFIVASLFAAGGIIITIILVLNSKLKIYKKNAKGIRIEELLSNEEFNKAEQALIKALWENENMLETSELEELIWSEVDNYDYRRKLRNETIRSINNKYKTLFKGEGKLVVRKKDPNDHRRFHYGLNKIVIE